jgi:FOG: WD40 repeat
MKGDDPFSNDGQRFVVVTTDIGPVFVKIYNVAKVDEPDSLKSQRGLKSIRFINADSQLLLVYDQAVDLWSMASGEKLKTSRSYDGTGCLVIKDINDENVASITNYDHVITDDKNKAGLCIYEPENWRTTFISESQGLVAYGDNSKLSILNVQSADSKEQNMRGVNLKNIIRVAISPDGTLLAAALEDNSIHIWDLETHEELTSLSGHDKSITDLQFTPDGKLLISTSLDGTLRLWGVPY